VPVYAGLAGGALAIDEGIPTPMFWTSSGHITIDTKEAWKDLGIPCRVLIEVPGTSWDEFGRPWTRHVIPHDELSAAPEPAAPRVLWWQEEKPEEQKFVALRNDELVFIGSDIVVDSAENWAQGSDGLKLVRVPATTPGITVEEWRTR
jgi:hypothetical protein